MRPQVIMNGRSESFYDLQTASYFSGKYYDLLKLTCGYVICIFSKAFDLIFLFS